MDVGWLRRRWVEFRWGHSTYLAFLLSGVNFILIVYRMLIEQVPILQMIFYRLHIFVFVFVILYPPLAILIGRWHRKKQLAIDTSLTAEHNPYAMEMVERLRRIEAKVEKMMESGETKDRSET